MAMKDEMEALKEQVAALTAALEAKEGGAPTKRIVAAVPPEEARKAVLAARSKEPKTYRALMPGTDLKQGLIPAGTVFTTTQPQGSWMELVEDDTAEEAEAE